MLKWVGIAAAVIVGIPGLLALVGSFLPKGHTVSRTVLCDAPPEQVWAAVSDQTWFKSDVAVSIETSEPMTRLVTRVMPNPQFGGTWTFALKPVGGGTELTITEDGEVYNPIFRAVQKLVLSPYKTIDTYLAALRQHMAG